MKTVRVDHGHTRTLPKQDAQMTYDIQQPFTTVENPSKYNKGDLINFKICFYSNLNSIILQKAVF